MAVLSDKSGLSMEVRFATFSHFWVEYELRFLYGGVPLFNPAVTRRDTFPAKEYHGDSLIPALQEALDKNENVNWEPPEPDLRMEITPVPALGWEEASKEIHEKYSAEEEMELREVDDRRARLGGKLAEDRYELLCLVDSSVMKPMSEGQEGTYLGWGPAVCLTVDRGALEHFVDDLMSEYEEFIEKNQAEFDKLREFYG